MKAFVSFLQNQMQKSEQKLAVTQILLQQPTLPGKLTDYCQYGHPGISM